MYIVPFQLPRTRRTVYVQASSLKTIQEVLHRTPYSNNIRLKHVPKPETFALVRYLYEPILLDSLSWVRIKNCRGYTGDIALLSSSRTLLVIPRYRIDNLRNPAQRQSKNTSVMSSSPIEDCSQLPVPHHLGSVTSTDYGLFTVTLRSYIHTIEPLHATITTAFIDAVSQFLESEHPDPPKAWKKIWRKTWRIDCTVESTTGFQGKLKSVEEETDLVEVEGDTSGYIPRHHLNRIVQPGEFFVVVFGPHTGRIAVVVSTDSHGLLVLNDIDDMIEFTSPPFYLLDADPFAQVLEGRGLRRTIELEGIRPKDRQPALREYVVITKGPFKGYKADVVDIKRGTVRVEIVGLVGGKQLNIDIKSVIPV